MEFLRHDIFGEVKQMPKSQIRVLTFDQICSNCILACMMHKDWNGYSYTKHWNYLRKAWETAIYQDKLCACSISFFCFLMHNICICIWNFARKHVIWNGNGVEFCCFVVLPEGVFIYLMFDIQQRLVITWGGPNVVTFYFCVMFLLPYGITQK